MIGGMPPGPSKGCQFHGRATGRDADRNGNRIANPIAGSDGEAGSRDQRAGATTRPALQARVRAAPAVSTPNGAALCGGETTSNRSVASHTSG